MAVGVVVGVVVGKAVSRRGRAAAAGRAAAHPLGMFHLRALLRALLLVVVPLGSRVVISRTAIAPVGRSAVSRTRLPAWRCYLAICAGPAEAQLAAIVALVSPTCLGW